MNKIIATAMAAIVSTAMSAAVLAQRVTPTPAALTPAASQTQTLQAPYAPTNPDRSVAQSRPLFSIGQLPVVVWAPVQPPYNSKLSGTQAANALWDVNAF
jgi:hypothetical protein